MDFQEFLIESTKLGKKGFLIAFEGVDGSGKSSTANMLYKWLKSQHYDVLYTKWNSSDSISTSIKKLKEKRALTPQLYCLMHAADMVFRYENQILPSLEDNKIVIADRYYFTSMVRDLVRGIDTTILNKIYNGYREPDIIFHCHIDVKKAVNRVIKGKGLTYYGSGMDINLAGNKEKSCLKYENLMNDAYNKILKKCENYYKLNTDRDINSIFDEVKDTVINKANLDKYLKK